MKKMDFRIHVVLVMIAGLFFALGIVHGSTAQAADCYINSVGDAICDSPQVDMPSSTNNTWEAPSNATVSPSNAAALKRYYAGTPKTPPSRPIFIAPKPPPPVTQKPPLTAFDFTVLHNKALCPTGDTDACQWLCDNGYTEYCTTTTGGGTTNGSYCSAESLMPQGIYVVDDGSPEYAEALQSADVDGGLVRVGWEMIETSDGTYNWTSVCNKINTVVNAGKSVSLVVSTMSPDWLNSQVPANELWTHPQFGETVVPWSELGQQKMQEFLTELANHDCGNGALKDLPNIKQVDAPILGMLGIRQAPSTDINTLTDAILTSIGIVRDAWGSDHVFYTSLFPLTGCCGGSDDSATIRNAILAQYPDHAFFVENWTGDGPSSGPMGDLLEYGESCRTFPVMMQACGYWSDQNKIPCSFDGSSDTPKNGYDKVVVGYQGQYLEIYPADILQYASDISYIHDAIQQVSCNATCTP